MQFVKFVVWPVVLAGCASPAELAEPPAAADSTATPGFLPWELLDCLEVSAYYLVPAERVRPFLPEGFTPAGGGPGAAAGMAQGGMNAFRCATGKTADHGTASDVMHGSFFVRVNAPEEIAGQGVCCRYVKWNTIVDDEAERAALQAAGASVQAGSVAFSGELPSAPGRFAVTLEMEGVGTTTFSIAAHQPGGGAGAWLFREYSPTPAGPVVWESTAVYRDSVGGEGFVEVPAGSIPAQLYGSTRIPAQFAVNRLSLEDGWIALPGASAGASGGTAAGSTRTPPPA